MKNDNNLSPIKNLKEKDIECILDEGVLCNLKIFFMNNDSHEFQQLTVGEINKIRSEHPNKIEMCFRQSHYDPSTGYATEGHSQSLNFVDLWTDKSLIANLLDNINLSKKDFNETDGSVYKMIYAVAVAQYSYDPTKKRNTATGKNKHSIQAAVEALGLTIDEGTVHDQLQKAVELFPEVKELLKNRKTKK